ncbi:MAG: hypothetical protein K2Q09_03365 [Phycisphaerales bacterium]|nr:hypothetical protein [Chloroflexota bacterium]MBY0307758.1 hypothetical protein [Phycisphaerales bacterium]
MFASTLFRTLIVAFIAAGMQLCCCGAAWLRCAACDCPDDGAAVALGMGAGHDHSRATEHNPGAATPKAHGDRSLCGDHEGNRHKEKCTCAAQDPRNRPGDYWKIGLTAPVFSTPLPVWDLLPPIGVASREQMRLDRPPVRPALSLLRQHCALIV